MGSRRAKKKVKLTDMVDRFTTVLSAAVDGRDLDEVQQDIVKATYLFTSVTLKAKEVDLEEDAELHEELSRVIRLAGKHKWKDVNLSLTGIYSALVSLGVEDTKRISTLVHLLSDDEFTGTTFRVDQDMVTGKIINIGMYIDLAI